MAGRKPDPSKQFRIKFRHEDIFKELRDFLHNHEKSGKYSGDKHYIDFKIKRIKREA